MESTIIMKVDPGPSDVAGHLTPDPCPDPSDVRDDHLDSSQVDPEVRILTNALIST